ncbi:MAG: hypothetical protein JSU70_15770 [Phycisphaerales bacterium]|nr:MAG: hypothetical protein JSU70_15770 [Phycisphaerales bacterium]
MAVRALQQIGSLAFLQGLSVVVYAGIPRHVIAAKDLVAPWWLRTTVFCLLGGSLVLLLTLALEQTKDQIMHAAIFVWCILLLGILKVLG